MDTGIGSAVGWVKLTTLLLRRFASFARATLPPFGDPKDDILRIPSAMGFKSSADTIRREDALFDDPGAWLGLARPPSFPDGTAGDKAPRSRGNCEGAVGERIGGPARPR